MKLKICHLYPDVLNLYGDRGNIVCMEQRLKWRGIESEVTRLSVGESEPLSSFDIIFAGGGQDFEQGILTEDLRRGKTAEIKAAVEDGKVFLAVCGGYQMLGNYYETHTGARCDFAGVLDFYTVGHAERVTGDYAFELTPECGGSVVVGFENHSGRTYLGPELSPLGILIKGFGNNGEDRCEGAKYKNVFGTYCHGPVLPKNPLFADFLLELALKMKYPGAELEPLDNTLEFNAHRYMLERLTAK